MPWSVAKAFQRSSAYAVDENRYCDGSRQAKNYSTNSRNKWNLTEALTATQAAALDAFYLARNGGTQEFWFYDVYETDNFAYDMTGVSTDGRYAVRFDGSLQLSLLMARSQGQISLVEVG